MATLVFKAKIDPEGMRINPDHSIDHVPSITVPALQRSHCRLETFRGHKLNSYVNSNILPAALHREMVRAGVGKTIYLDSLPEFITVDATGFLAVVTVQL